MLRKNKSEDDLMIYKKPIIFQGIDEYEEHNHPPQLRISSIKKAK